MRMKPKPNSKVGKGYGQTVHGNRSTNNLGI